MPLDLTVDSIDALDDAIKPLYVERDGKFHLDVSGLEDTSGLKSALASERKAAKTAEAAMARWKTLGKSPEEIEELLAAQVKADEDKATKAGEWDKLRAQMNDKHQAELKAKDDATTKMRTSLERYLVDAAATSAIAAAKGVPELLLPHVQRQVKVVDEDGEFVARVVDAKGDPRVDGKGAPLTIAGLVEEMRANDIYGRAFEATGRSGSGAQPSESRGPAKTISGAAFAALSGKERAAKFAEGYVLTE